MTRTQLAREFFPELDAETAGKKMCNVIFHSPLFFRLRAVGYRSNDRYYSISMVRIIREFISNNPQYVKC